MITELTSSNEKEWDTFVENNECSYYFKIAWRDIVYQNFKHKYVYYLHKNEENKIDGILPLFIAKSFLSTKIISIPYCPYGGVITKDEAVKDLLIAKAINLSKSLGAKYIELKENKLIYKNFVESSNYFSFKLDLNKPVDDLWTNLSKSTKRKIRKAEKNKTRITIDSNIDIFYTHYIRHLKKMGTPAIKIDFFKELVQNDESNVKVATIWYENDVAASILLLETKNGVIYDRGSTAYNLRYLNLNYTLFWEVIKYYAKSGFLSFDFGRSVRESGTFQFKNSWRPDIIKLRYQYYINSGQPIDHSQEGWKRKTVSKILKTFPRVAFVDNYLRKLFP